MRRRRSISRGLCHTPAEIICGSVRQLAAATYGGSRPKSRIGVSDPFLRRHGITRGCGNAGRQGYGEATMGKAPEILAKALLEEGPSILRSGFVHGKTSESRLQVAPDDQHNGEHDPH